MENAFLIKAEMNVASSKIGSAQFAKEAAERRLEDAIKGVRIWYWPFKKWDVGKSMKELERTTGEYNAVCHRYQDLYHQLYPSHAKPLAPHFEKRGM